VSTVALAAFPFALCIGFAVAIYRTFRTRPDNSAQPEEEKQ